jgi:hypothetical protein
MRIQIIIIKENYELKVNKLLNCNPWFTTNHGEWFKDKRFEDTKICGN